MANRNTLWANTFVDELARSGLTAVCAAPGSRHTPLMLAFAKHEKIKVYSHLDERSASFFALGLALASDSPVALVCTSGTAGANMYPAIIEAHQSRVPLIVLTADRPHELRHSGANQTIDQIKMFGDFVLWFADMQLPEAQPPAIALRNLRTTANRAYATANGLRKGVVHLNFPFRKPLEPTAVEGDLVAVSEDAELRNIEELDWNVLNTHETADGFATFSHGTSHAYRSNLSLDDTETLKRIFTKYEKGIVIGGRSIAGAKSGLSESHFISKVKYPYFVDILSGYRLTRMRAHDHELGGYENYLNHLFFADYRPDVIIRFDDVPLSKNLNQFINRANPKYYIHVSPDGVWADDSHSVSRLIHISIENFVNYFIRWMDDFREKSQWFGSFKMAENVTWQTIDHEMETGEYFDGAVVYDLVELIPDESTLFAGNSLPVRHLDQFGKPQNKRIYTYANRGASGIDGNISTALGAGAARPDKPVVAVMGDITFYHDMNGLLAVHRCGVPITIVLLNNDGGGIFNRLPINQYDPEFTEYFITPHGLDFSHAAKLYGLDYVSIDTYAEGARDQFREAFSNSVGGSTSTIIEVRTDSKRDDARRKEIVAAVGERIKQLNI